MAAKIGISTIRKGTDNDDTLWGYDFAEFYYGLGGNDTFLSSGGADFYDGGSGMDTVSYAKSDSGVTVYLGQGPNGAGFGGDAEGDTYRSIEKIEGSRFNDRIDGDDGDNRLLGMDGDDRSYGGDGADTIVGGNGNDHGYGGYGDDYLSGGAGDDYLRGGNGDDDLYAGTGDDRLFGDDGDDLLRGASGDDLLGGGGGDDLLYGDDGDDRLFGQSGSDQLIGGYGADLLNGGRDNDNLQAGSGDDQLIGGRGDDELTGGEGADIIHGGDGFDIARYHADGVIVDLTTSTGAGGDAEGDTLFEVEAVRTDGDDVSVYGDVGANVFYVVGASGAFEGRSGDDVFASALYGDNNFDGGAGSDTVDYSFSESVRDNIVSGHHVDLAAGEADSLANDNQAPDTLVSIENVIGTYRGDVIRGDAQDNVLDGGDGDDVLNGRRGNDTLTGGAGADVFEFVNNDDDPDQDIVTDFDVGVDKIDFSDNANFIDNFNEFQQNSTQQGTDVVIDNGAGTITLRNVDLEAITANDFYF